jgi:Flp pilus assembly protein TadG
MSTLRNRTASATRPWRRRDGRGQSLVEFAIVYPVFILLLAGMIDFGLGLYSNLTIINAAREGARLGTVQAGDTAAIEDRVRAMATGLDNSRLTVTTTCLRPSGTLFITCPAPGWESGDTVYVKVDYDYSMIWPLTFGTRLGLSSTVQMRIE